MSETAPLIDERHWDRLRSSLTDKRAPHASMPPLLREVVERYIPTTHQRLAEIRSALIQGRREDAVQLAHALCGSNAMLGASRAAALAAALEELLPGLPERLPIVDGQAHHEVFSHVAELEQACEQTASALAAKVTAATTPVMPPDYYLG